MRIRRLAQVSPKPEYIFVLSHGARPYTKGRVLEFLVQLVVVPAVAEVERGPEGSSRGTPSTGGRGWLRQAGPLHRRRRRGPSSSRRCSIRNWDGLSGNFAAAAAD